MVIQFRVSIRKRKVTTKLDPHREAFWKSERVSGKWFEIWEMLCEKWVKMRYIYRLKKNASLVLVLVRRRPCLCNGRTTRRTSNGQHVVRDRNFGRLARPSICNGRTMTDEDDEEASTGRSSHYCRCSKWHIFLFGMSNSKWHTFKYRNITFSIFFSPLLYSFHVTHKTTLYKIT